MASRQRRSGPRADPHARVVEPAPADEQEREEDATIEDAESADRGRQFLRGLVSLAIIGAVVVALLFAVPGLSSVAKLMRHASAGWVVAAVVLEILSCVGFILAFQLVFARAPLRFAARLALAEIGFGAALSVGGAGGYALGAWVLRERGVPLARIAERSGVLFLLTSAANVFVLIAAGLGLGLGVFNGPSNPLLSWLPAAVGTLVLVFFLALPRWADSAAGKRDEDSKWGKTLHGLAEVVTNTKKALFTPNWRLVGAFAYLLCDIGVLWACFKALGHEPPFAALVLAYQIGYMANIIPIPGGIGVLDAGLVGMLTIYGAGVTESTAAVLIYHAISLWVPALWGALAYLLLRRTLNEPLVPRDG